MIRSKQVGEDIVVISVIEEGKVLFESLWETEGIHYNSYLIHTSEGVILVDTAPEEYAAEYLDVLREKLNGETLNYIIINHMEPDHSGALSYILKEYPDTEVLLSTVGKTIFNPPRSTGVKNGEVLALGDKEIRFHHTPWVHWPETMITQLDDILFTGDLLGAFGTYTDWKVENEDYYLENLHEYTATVLMGYRDFLLRALKTVEEIEPSIVAPAHGPILRGREIERYVQHLVKTLEEPSGTLILYSSMYGHSGSIAKEISRQFGDALLLDVVNRSISDILGALLTSNRVLIITPTYEADIFPKMKYILELAGKKNLLRGKKVVAVITYLWNPANKHLEEFLKNMGADVVVFPYKAIEDPAGIIYMVLSNL